MPLEFFDKIGRTYINIKMDHFYDQGSARPTFAFGDRVRDWNFQSRNFETGSETQIFLASVLRPSPRLNFSESQF